MYTRKLWIAGILILNSFSVLAQEPREFTVLAGEIVIEVIPLQEQYLFREFPEGKAVFFTNEYLPARFNYSFLYGDIHFLNKEGDTLAIGNGHKLKYVKIEKDFFYFSHKEGFLKETKKYPEISLVEKQLFKARGSDMAFINGYEPHDKAVLQQGSDRIFGSNYSSADLMASGNPSGEANKNRKTTKQLYTQKTPILLKIKKNTSYFFMDRNRRFYPAKQSSILKIFFRNRNAIKSYLKQHDIDFNHREDLIKLLDYCSRFSKN